MNVNGVIKYLTLKKPLKKMNFYAMVVIDY